MRHDGRKDRRGGADQRYDNGSHFLDACARSVALCESRTFPKKELTGFAASIALGP
jgi:hypothetical protein